MTNSTSDPVVSTATLVVRLVDVVHRAVEILYGHVNRLTEANIANQQALVALVEEVEALREGKASKTDLAGLRGTLNHMRQRLNTLEEDLPRALEDLATISELEGKEGQ